MARKKSLRVERVERVDPHPNDPHKKSSDKFVFQVIIVYDERVRLNFIPDFSRFNHGGFKLRGRGQANGPQLAQAKELGISRRGYARIVKVAAAIFAENRRDAKGQKVKGG